MNPEWKDRDFDNYENENKMKKMITNLQNQISNINKLLDSMNIPIAFIYKEGSRRELTIEERFVMYINSQKKF